MENWLNSPDVIILGLEMSVMDGCTAAKAIREHENVSGKRSFMLGLTGYTRTESVDRCMEAGMDDCFSKPAKKQVLLASIAQCFLADVQDGA